MPQSRFSVHYSGVTIAQYLFLLENLSLVDQRRYGHKTYYLRNQKSTNYIEYGRTIGERTVDRLRFSDFLKEALPKDRDRVRVYKRHNELAGLK